ncbi:hypothetical protein [uncultured Flavobacterium sp.]|uniref:hypothetical protein n=1 Tax=uncultured Flavobacterium sp. TaxID=165435 RepID=UPI0025CDC6BC|nr:hypothetical protein [uncultured Flavobacterium sp.]
MKRITLLSVLFGGLLFASCSDDDSNSTDNNNNNNNPIDVSQLSGKWRHDKEGFRIQDMETLEDYEHGEGCNKDYIEFLEDGIFKHVVYDGNNNCHEVVGTKYYFADGDTFTIGEDGEFTASRIEVLSDTQLKTKTIYSYEDGTSPTYWIETYTKIE